MFQRQAKEPFPVRNILIVAALVLGFLCFLFKSRPDHAATPPTTPEKEETEESSEKKDAGLWPVEWFYAVREYPTFRPSVKAYAQALAELRRVETAAKPRGSWPGFAAPWTVQGPGNIGARINTIKVHPTDPNIMYIGYSGGGLWKTTDGGNNWQSVFDRQTFLAIGDIELDPKNPNVVYAGTGDPNISAYPFIGDGLWKSTDGGQNWQHLGLTEQRIISKIIVDPNNSNVLYVATMGLPFERNNKRGLYKTVNGGQSWQQILFVSDQSGVIDLEMAPDNSSVLYAAVWDRLRSNRESVVTGSNARIWKTTDGGSSWAKLSGGLPEGNQSRIGLTIDPLDGNRVLASFAGTDLSFEGLYETNNGGQSWIRNTGAGFEPYFQSNFAWYFGKIQVNPFDPKDIWALGVYTLRSRDGGKTWGIGAGFEQNVHADHHDIYFADAQTTLLATDGGLYQSTDDGQSWHKQENIPTTQFYRVAHNPNQPEKYYGGAQDNGTVAGNASGRDAWEHLFGGDGFQAVFHPENPNVFYFEYQNGAIQGTTDGGQSFEDATSGIEGDDRRHWDMPYLMSRTDYNVMYTGTYRVYRSEGHIPTWTPVSPDLTDGNIFGARFHTISTLDESFVDPDLVYVGTTDGNVWKGNPLAQTWDNISAGLPDRYVSAVKASLNDPDRVFVAMTGYRDNDFTPRLHRSDDRGKTWQPINGNLPNLAINDLQLIVGHQDSVIFAATDGGVYATLDGGKNWERLGRDMPFVPVYDLDFNATKKTLIAGSHARSIFSFPVDSLRLGSDVSAGEPDDRKVPILNVWPTLASSEVKIGVENLLSRQTATVLISDMAGRVVWQAPFKGFQSRPVEVPLQDLAPGIYVAFARTDGKVWGQKKFIKINP